MPTSRLTESSHLGRNPRFRPRDDRRHRRTNPVTPTRPAHCDVVDVDTWRSCIRCTVRMNPCARAPGLRGAPVPSRAPTTDHPCVARDQSTSRSDDDRPQVRTGEQLDRCHHRPGRSAARSLPKPTSGLPRPASHGSGVMAPCHALPGSFDQPPERRSTPTTFVGPVGSRATTYALGRRGCRASDQCRHCSEALHDHAAEAIGATPACCHEGVSGRSLDADAPPSTEWIRTRCAAKLLAISKQTSCSWRAPKHLASHPGDEHRGDQ